MKNILIVDNNLPYLLNNINFSVGGSTIQTRNWMHGFEKQGYDIVVSSSVNIKNSSKYIIENTSYSKYSIRIFNVFAVIYTYIKILKKYKPNFIYISTPFWSNILIALAAKAHNIKIVQIQFFIGGAMTFRCAARA